MDKMNREGHNYQPEQRPVIGPSSFQGREICATDYFRIVWKRKWLVVGGTLLPALIAGMILFVRPAQHRLTYIYETSLAEKDYRVLRNEFYSEENLAEVARNFRENGLEREAARITEANTNRQLINLVDLEMWPFLYKEERIRTVRDVEEIHQSRGVLLSLIIKDGSKQHVRRLAEVIRGNFEGIVPLYSVQRDLRKAIARIKGDMASIEENRFQLELALNTHKSTLKKLKQTEPTAKTTSEGDVTLQFDVAGKSEYLPLSYQVQATESKIIGLEEQLEANRRKYNYYEQLVALNEKLLGEIVNRTSDYSLLDYRDFLRNLAAGYEQGDVADYLNAYLKRIENTVAEYTPVVENPKVYAAPKNVLRWSATVSGISLLVMVLSAFYLEGLEQSRKCSPQSEREQLEEPSVSE